MDIACGRNGPFVAAATEEKMAAATRKTGGACWEMAIHGSKSGLRNSQYSLSLVEKS